MLRNIFYDRKRSIIHHWYYDEVGEEKYDRVQYKPFLYIPSVDVKKVDAYGIDDVPLTRKEFVSEWERRTFLKSFKGLPYFNLPATQQYLLEKYYRTDIQELTRQPLRTFFYDIEVVADEFPDPKDAKFPLTSITIYDTKTRKYFVWGTKPYDVYSCKDHLKDIEPEEIQYEYCINEKDLLKKFIRFWRANFPDLIVGYNSYSFDLPYIVHRINAVFEDGYGRVLSPVNYIYGQEKLNAKYQKTYMEYDIGGISHLDYMLLYKTFTPGERESDSLDYVCFEELTQGKLDYGDVSLQELSVKDWNKFINYNIWDVKLMVMLDNKRKYLDIAKFSAFSGFCNLPQALGKTSIITGILAKQALNKNKIISTKNPGEKESLPGGFVKQPECTMKTDVVSFDANSLYPSTIITLNISPETKVAKKLEEDDENISLYVFKTKEIKKFKKTLLPELLKKANWSMSANGIFFSQKEKGVAAEFCDELYTKRKLVRKDVEGLEKKMENMDKESVAYKALRTEADQKDTEQYLYKILLNSTYGAFANRYFSLYDIDCASSITTTGQAMIQKTEQILNDFIAKEWDLEWKDRVVGIDTDSNLITLEDVRAKLKFDLIDANGDLTPEFTEIENKISDHLNLEIKEWAIDTYNSKDPRFFFKRESVCPKAIWTGKKHYILHLVNKEGKKMDKFKYSGLSLAKSTWSLAVKKIGKKIVEDVIMKSQDQRIADKMIYDVYDNDFKKLPVKDIAERSSLKVLNKWEGLNTDFDTAKGTTKQAKYAIYYNELLKKLHLENKYPKIVNGSKIKMLTLKDNIFNIEGVAFQDELPPEFTLEVDYDEHFFKGVLKTLEPIYEALKWKIPDPKKQPVFSLDDLFG